MFEIGIQREEKSLKKLQRVLDRLRSRRNHQDKLYQEAKMTLHEFRVSV